jgi:hypothetical protein
MIRHCGERILLSDFVNWKKTELDKDIVKVAT